MPARGRNNGNTESVDNYLKAILTLGGAEPLAGVDARRVTSKSLAERLKVAPASVTNMLQKLALATSPLVEYERHRGVRLSAIGRRRALEIVRHHRLIETFLYEVLDYPLEEVHEEAERLEHFISERFEERIAAKLGHPKLDPHGHSIPTMDGYMPKQRSVALTELPLEGIADRVFVIDSISDRDARTLRLLKSSGITPGARLSVKKHTMAKTVAGTYSVRVGQATKALAISSEIAREIRIRPAPAKR